MPQMAPLSWLILFMFFLMILMMFNMMNYFCFSSSPNMEKQPSPTATNMNWTW